MSRQVLRAPNFLNEKQPFIITFSLCFHYGIPRIVDIKSYRFYVKVDTFLMGIFSTEITFMIKGRHKRLKATANE